METNIINQITTRDQERLRSYKDLLDFYQGKQWPGRERWGGEALNLQLRPRLHRQNNLLPDVWD